MSARSVALSRRGFLQAGLATGVGFFTFGRDFWTEAIAAPARTGPSPYGPLVGPDANGLYLPRGFTSRRVAQFGSPVPLSDGTTSDYPWHRGPDGGAVFMQDDGGWIYVSNSEQPVTDGGAGAVRFDADGNVTAAYPILTGTNNNCAGGPTPWGTWLSCEENFFGFVYECDPTGSNLPVRLVAMGQFNHEAAAVDPVGRRVYLTEDQGDGALYRFTPAAYPDLTTGTLEVAVVDPSFVRVPMGRQIRDAFEAIGGDIDDFDPTGVLGEIDETPPGPVQWRLVPNPLGLPLETRYQVPSAAIFKGGEGCWYDDGVVFFTCKGSDRVWQYDTRSERVDIVYDVADQGPDPVLSGVDNITVHAQSGDLLVAEDGGNMELVIVTANDRAVAPFLRYPVPDSEIAGPAFTADGTRLYFSSQAKNVLPLGGETFEITGPFRGTVGALGPPAAVPAAEPGRSPGGPGSPPDQGGPTAVTDTPAASAGTGARDLPSTGPGWAGAAGTGLLAAAAAARAVAGDGHRPPLDEDHPPPHELSTERSPTSDASPRGSEAGA